MLKHWKKNIFIRHIVSRGGWLIGPPLALVQGAFGPVQCIHFTGRAGNFRSSLIQEAVVAWVGRKGKHGGACRPHRGLMYYQRQHHVLRCGSIRAVALGEDATGCRHSRS